MNPDRRHIAGHKPPTLFPVAPWLRWGWNGLFVPGHSANQFMRFCLVGLSGVFVNAAVMWVLYRPLGVAYVLASVGAFLVASVNNFIWNKLFTFQDPDWSPAALSRQYAKFLSVTLFGLAINLGVLVLLVEVWVMDPVLANLVGVFVATISNFLGNKYFAFKVRP